MPFEQAFRGQAQAGGIVWIDHHQHVEAVEEKIDFLLHHFTHDVTVAAPGFGVLGITGRQHPDLAGTTQARQ
ncbi:hypothetical protein D3C85_817670 [compost metagenome]